MEYNLENCKHTHEKIAKEDNDMENKIKCMGNEPRKRKTSSLCLKVITAQAISIILHKL